MSETPQESSTGDPQRDAQVLQILGSFFSLMGVLVLISIFWCWDNDRAVVVTIACGAALGLVGVGMILFGRRAKRRVRSDQHKHAR